MKKIISICLIMATVIVVNAQEKKPTKEETVAYLTRSYKLVEGVRIEGDNDFVFNKYVFSENSIMTTYPDGENSRNTDFKWETLRSISELNCKVPGEREICRMYVYFDAPFMVDDDRHMSTLIVFVLKSKAESVRKAFLRLSEIAKEENKDPFQD